MGEYQSDPGFQNNGLIFKAVGEFDDPESGFVVLGELELIKKLV